MLLERQKKRIQSPILWEISRLRGGQAYDATDDIYYNKKTGKSEYEEIDEQEPDLELNETGPPFLKGMKGSVALSPIKVARAMAGSLQGIAMNQARLAKRRKEKREEEQRSKLESVPAEISKVLDDPSSNLIKKDIMSILASFGGDNFTDMPDWKKESVVRNYGQVKRSSMNIKEQQESLPIFKLKDSLKDAIEKNRILVIIGEIGRAHV